MILVLTRDDLSNGIQDLSLDYIDVSSFPLVIGLKCIMRADFVIFIDTDQTQKILKDRYGQSGVTGQNLLQVYFDSTIGV